MAQQTIPSLLLHLYEQGFFHQERQFDDIMKELSAMGSHPTPQNLNIALSRVRFLTKRGRPGQYRYIQKNNPKHISLTKEIFSDELTSLLIKDFKIEFAELKHNFGISGTCTAFLLRKILEKLLFLTFAKNGKETLLLDANNKLIGLHAMITLATSTKIGGKPFLMQKTAEEIKSVKFLGDTAAHNPLANVSMKTIVPVMPYIVTAYTELAATL